jgi:hypothetical protein
MSKPSDESLQLAAQCWCDEETRHIEMEVNLATAFAKRLDALQSQAKESERLLHEARVQLRDYEHETETIKELKAELDQLRNQKFDGKYHDTLRADYDALKAEVARLQDLHDKDAVIVDMRERDKIQAKLSLRERQLEIFKNKLSKFANEIRKVLPRAPSMNGIESYSHEQKIVHKRLQELNEWFRAFEREVDEVEEEK